MIEFRIANHEEGIEEYLTEWGEILQNKRTFYHLYVDGVKKDDTLYICHMFDKAYCFGTHEECNFGWTDMKSIRLTNGLILIHKVVEDHYSEEVMRMCHKDGEEYNDKCLRGVQVLINSNGIILYQSDDYHDRNHYYNILSERLFSTHKSHDITSYYRIEEDRVVKIFEGFEEMKSDNCVYGHLSKKIGSYYNNSTFNGKDTSIVYCLNKYSLDVTMDA